MKKKYNIPVAFKIEVDDQLLQTMSAERGYSGITSGVGFGDLSRKARFCRFDDDEEL